MRHKHADLIIEWANGVKIQFENIHGEWVNDDDPHWYPDVNYRIKPETLKYRVALFKRDSGGYYATSCNEINGDDHQECRNFVRWLTDWTEVEI